MNNRMDSIRPARNGSATPSDGALDVIRQQAEQIARYEDRISFVLADNARMLKHSRALFNENQAMEKELAQLRRTVVEQQIRIENLHYYLESRQ